MDHEQDTSGLDAKSGPGTREALLAVAAALFAERGYSGTSIRDLCAAAAVTRPTLYYYFGSKQGLAEALFDDAAARFTDALRAAVPGRGTLREKLRAIARSVFERSRAEPHISRLLYASMFSPPHMHGRRAFDTVMAKAVAEIATLVREGSGQEVRSDIDPEVAAMVMVGALHAYGIRFVRQPDFDLSPELAEQVVDMILDGLTVVGVERKMAPPADAPRGGANSRH